MNSDKIYRSAEKYLKHDMIGRYTQLPEFPRHRSNLLCSFLNYGANEADHEVHESYALVTSLVQMGLDTHDMVESTNQFMNQKEMRSTQLKILAGDYFSSRYYQLLADRGQIELIQLISVAISEVNRLKMNFYLNRIQFVEDREKCIGQLVLIKIQLFLPFYSLMKKEISRYWSDMLKSVARCEVIVEYLRETHELYNFELTEMLENQLTSIQQKINAIDSSELMNDLYQIIKPFYNYTASNKVLKEI